MNKVFLMGHIGQDFDLRQTDTGMSVVNFRLATNSTWRDNAGELHQRTDWHNIVAWGNQAEALHASLGKGSHIYVEGNIQTRSYEREHKIGKRKVKVTTYVTEIIAREVKPLGMETIERAAA